MNTNNALKILLLEDSSVDAEIVQRLLKKELPHAVVLTVMEKPLFQKALTEFIPDVILADNSLPQLNATEALELSRIAIPFIPFIMVTGTVSEEFAAGIIKSGADDYILKDRLARLPTAIDAALKKCEREKEKQAAIERQKLDEEKYRMLIERVSDGFMALNIAWEIVYINPVAERMMQRDSGYLLGKNLWKEYPELINKGFYTGYHHAIETQKNLRLVEFILPYKVWVEASVYPSLTGISVFFRDITEQKKIEELDAELEREKKLNELKSAFVSMVSHEFRTPLTTVLSSTYIIQKYAAAEDQPKREKHLERIISSVSTLIDTLNDLLSLGQIEEGKIRVNSSRFHLAEMVSSTIEDLKNNLKKSQTITYTHTGEAEVSLDRSLLKHILMNLISNAGKFSSDTDNIEISTSCHQGHIIVSVKDHGIGISQEDQQHLAERFFRGANTGNIQGTGLGLNIISKYAELMNGKMECHSELGQGTEFIITLLADTDQAGDTLQLPA